MARDANGNIFFADEFNNKIREIQSNNIILDLRKHPHTWEIPRPPQLNIWRTMVMPLCTLTSIAPDVNASIDTTVQNPCAIGTAYGPLSGCTVGTQFKPTTTGDPLIGHINVAANAGGSSPFDIQLAGHAIPASQTTLTLTAIPNPSAFEQSVAFEATAGALPPADAKPGFNPGIPGGTVTYFADGATIGSAALDTTGRATFSYFALTVGTHTITATYGGSNDYLTSIRARSRKWFRRVPTATSLGASSGGGANSGSVLVATVVGGHVVSSYTHGNRWLVNGTTTLGTVTLNDSGVATLSPQVATGNYTVVATYSGDAVHDPSSSVAVTITPVPTNFDIAVTPSTLTVATGNMSR